MCPSLPLLLVCTLLPTYLLRYVFQSTYMGRRRGVPGRGEVCSRLYGSRFIFFAPPRRLSLLPGWILGMLTLVCTVAAAHCDSCRLFRGRASFNSAAS